MRSDCSSRWSPLTRRRIRRRRRIPIATRSGSGSSTTGARPLDAAGVVSRRLVRDGNPVSVLLAMADDEQADLIVVGSRGLGGYPELLLGSTSTQVAQRAHCPVTVFPAAATTTS